MGAVTPTEPIALSIVVPVFNGESFITGTVRELTTHLANLSVSAELIVVDDGSTDRTAERVHEALESSPVRASLLRLERNRGKGAAIAAGMRSACGESRVFIDADLAYPPETIDAIHAALTGDVDIAIASRTDPDSRLLLNPAYFVYAFSRHLVGRVFNLVIRLFLLPGIRDSQAGLKGFRAPAAKALFSGWLPRGFSMDLALLFRARRLGFRISQVPVLYRALDEPTTVRFARDTGRMLRDLALIRFRLVGNRFEQWSTLLGRRWVQFARRARHLLRADAATPSLVAAMGLGILGIAVGRLGLRSPVVTPLGWMLAIAALLLLAWRADLSRPPRRPRIFRAASERWWFLGVMTVAAVARFAWLGIRPPMEHGDSAECGLQGLAILQGHAQDIFSFSNWYQTPYLGYVPYALSFHLFDVSMWSLRLPSAIVGTAAVIPFYFLARRWVGIRAAILAAALFATSHAAMHFSRIGLWNIQILFYELTAFALLVGAVRRRDAAPAAAAGVVTGIALYAYTGGRLIPIVAFAFLALELLRDRSRAVRAAAYYAAGIAVTTLPLWLNYYQDPAVFQTDRTASVWVLSEYTREHVEATLGTADPLGVLWEQTRRTFLGFASLGDTSSQYGTLQPLLSPLTAALALGGLGLAVWRWRQPRFQFLLLWVGLGLVLGSILVIDPPSHTRLVVLFPVPYLLVTALLVASIRWLRRRIALTASAVSVLFLLIVAQSAAFNLVGYYQFNQEMGRVTREWDVLKVFSLHGAKYDYYLFTGPYMLADSPVFRLFSTGTRAVTGFSASDVPSRLGRDSAFVLTPEFRRLGPLISERFPGIEREVLTKEGLRKVIIYRCSAENGCRGGFS
jgi:glycosyltransferase involved in cell wall biosynthesis/4-amino-4-deoxy-L-arabinose transferase-like glycosyltransferase